MDDKHMENVLALQQIALTGTVTCGSSTIRCLNLQELFEFIQNNFDKLKKNDNIKNLLPILHYALQLEIDNKAADTLDISTFVSSLLSDHKECEADLNLVLQIIYQILKTLNTYDYKLEEEIVCDELISMLFCSQQQSRRILNANVMACLQLYMRKFKARTIIQKLWCKIIELNNNENNLKNIMQILLQLFDEFVLYCPDLHANSFLMTIIKKSIFSEINEECKAAYELLDKYMQLDIQQTSDDDDIQLERLQHDWLVCMTAFKNLQENQSHLMLPSLDALKHISEYSNTHLKEWINVLHRKILAHNNILVIRWALEYFLAKFTCAQMSSELLMQFLTTTNNTRLYNHEGYFMDKVNINNFLTADLQTFLHIFAQINWKSVPLHFWLEQLAMHETSSITDDIDYKLIMNIAARVRVLQNPRIRRATIKHFEYIFGSLIERLNLTDYIGLIETLYNIIDAYKNHDIFLEKFNDAKVINDLFSRRLYEILTYDLKAQDVSTDKFVATLVKALQNVPKEKHGWLRFLIAYDSGYTSEINSFCITHYDIDIKDVNVNALDDLIVEFHAKLTWHETEKTFVHTKTVDFFVSHCLKTYSDLLNLNLDIDELLNRGSHHTLLKCSELLGEYTETTANLSAFMIRLKEFVKDIKQFNCYKIIENILKYVKHTQDFGRQQNIAETILHMDIENSHICDAVLKSGIRLNNIAYIQLILYGETKVGDARIEEIYEIFALHHYPAWLWNRQFYMTSLPSDILNSLYKNFLSMNDEWSKKKPRYYENSKEHRQKLRIAAAFLHGLNRPQEEAAHNFWTEELWKPIMEQNNQLNIKYIYELIIAKCIQNTNAILERLKETLNYSASQQLSVISVTNCYWYLNWNYLSNEELIHIVNALLPLTMGAQFQTRLFAQLLLYKILQKAAVSGINIPSGNELKLAISTVLGQQLNELLELDVRLQLPSLYEELKESKGVDFAEVIMYITNMPADEFIQKSIFIKYEHFRKRNSHKNNQQLKETIAVVETSPISNCVLQRKMNPSSSEILEKTTLISYPDYNNNEMFVVASLIDKLPNLGGIARTCEVLGIRNLVLDSKSCIEKHEFKSLSMTAEKSLNLLEVKRNELIDFLKEKQFSGFKIVGAEQTAYSINFIDFKFPPKTILLLGHEKEGLPANLLAFLDYAVEIPQFGMIRSLNVHVTGSLFMWEYCKQHIAQK